MEAVHPLYRVCLIGPECTGKSTIAARLAARYQTLWVPEYAREYAARVARPLTAADVEPIARGQMALEDEGATSADGLLILDTDLVSTFVYARHYYAEPPDWIEPLLPTRLANLYLLFAPDLDFAPDEVRDPTADRHAIHDAMRAALDALNARCERVEGGWEERLSTTIRAIDSEQLSRPPKSD